MEGLCQHDPVQVMKLQHDAGDLTTFWARGIQRGFACTPCHHLRHPVSRLRQKKALPLEGVCCSSSTAQI